MPFLSHPFDFTATMKPLDGYTNADNDALERALMLIAEALNRPYPTLDELGQMTVAELRSWYKESTGSYPADMSETDLRELCLSYWESINETSEEMLP